jgi:hypothetical protein
MHHLASAEGCQDGRLGILPYTIHKDATSEKEHLTSPNIVLIRRVPSDFHFHSAILVRVRRSEERVCSSPSPEVERLRDPSSDR